MKSLTAALALSIVEAGCMYFLVLVWSVEEGWEAVLDKIQDSKV